MTFQMRLKRQKHILIFNYLIKILLGTVWKWLDIGRDTSLASPPPNSTPLMYRIHCGMLPFESGPGLRLQKSTLHVICPKKTCSERLTHLFFRSFSRAFEGECDRFGWWFVCVYMWFSVVLKTKSAGESLSLFLAENENEASGRKSGARRFTHKGKASTPKFSY